jgi:hypothetical protein
MLDVKYLEWKLGQEQPISNTLDTILEVVTVVEKQNDSNDSVRVLASTVRTLTETMKKLQ